MMAAIQGFIHKRPAAIVVGVACLWTTILTWPVAIHLDAVIYGGPGDSTGAIYAFYSWVHALQAHQDVFGNSMVGAPLGSGWEQLQLFVGQFALFTPLTALVGPVAAYNIGVLTSFPLTVIVTYWLGRELGFSLLGAAFMALAFAFVPAHVEKAMGHMMQTHMEVFSAILLFGVRWWHRGRKRDAALLGASAGLAVWTDPYIALIATVLTATFFVVSLATRRRPGEGLAKRLGVHATAGLGAAGVAALFLPAAVFMAHRPGTGSIATAVQDSRRSLVEVNTYSAHIHDYLLPWEQNPWLPDFIRHYQLNHLHGSNFVEQSLFVGYMVILLAVLGVCLGRSRLPVLLGSALVAVGFWFSLPPELSIAGVALHTPSYFLNSVAPVYRVYSRFGFMVLLGACLLAGLGLTVLQSRWRGHRPAWLVMVPFLVLALEFHNFPPGHAYSVLPAPAEYTWLRDQPQGIVAEYPIWPWGQTEEVLTHDYTLYAIVHHHPLLNGAIPQGKAWPVYQEVQYYDHPASIDRLRALGIRYVLVHVRSYEQVEGIPSPPPTSVHGLRYIRTINGVQLFVIA